jgi:hypothetical protein
MHSPAQQQQITQWLVAIVFSHGLHPFEPFDPRLWNGSFGGVSCHCCGAAAGNRHFCDYSNRSYIAVLFFEFLALEKIPLFHPRDRDT